MNSYLRAACTGVILGFFVIAAFNILRQDWNQVMLAAASMVGVDIVREHV